MAHTISYSRVLPILVLFCGLFFIWKRAVLLDYSKEDNKTKSSKNISPEILAKPSKYTSPETLAPCGEICTYDGKVVKPANETRGTYPQLQKDINCRNIMLRMAFRKHSIVKPPPKAVPSELRDQYSMSGAVSIGKFYRNDASNQRFKHSKQYMDTLISKVHDHVPVNMYRDGKCVQNTIEKYASRVRGLHGLVIGTQYPWLESILLANNASNVTTLEYNNLKIDHRQIQIYTPYNYADIYLHSRSIQFDFAATFSSLEHSGLGRYSDPLNPYGDLEAMAQVWCMLKPGAMFAVGIPSGTRDKLMWNAHRIYSKLRLPQLTANWQVDELVKCADVHSFIVLTKLPE